MIATKEIACPNGHAFTPDISDAPSPLLGTRCPQCRAWVNLGNRGHAVSAGPWYGIFASGDWMREQGSTAVLAWSDESKARKVAADEWGYDTYEQAVADGWCEVRPLMDSVHAAAPELLEAAKQMVRSLNGNPDDFAGMLAAHRALDAAIAKAES